MTTTRATEIVTAARAMGRTDQDIITTLQNILDLPITDELGALMRDRFSGDDDYDELVHEIDHELGNCTDENPECMWRYGDDDFDL